MKILSQSQTSSVAPQLRSSWPMRDTLCRTAAATQRAARWGEETWLASCSLCSTTTPGWRRESPSLPNEEPTSSCVVKESVQHHNVHSLPCRVYFCTICNRLSALEIFIEYIIFFLSIFLLLLSVTAQVLPFFRSISLINPLYLLPQKAAKSLNVSPGCGYRQTRFTYKSCVSLLPSQSPRHTSQTPLPCKASSVWPVSTSLHISVFNSS